MSFVSFGLNAFIGALPVFYRAAAVFICHFSRFFCTHGIRIFLSFENPGGENWPAARRFPKAAECSARRRPHKRRLKRQALLVVSYAFLRRPRLPDVAGFLHGVLRFDTLGRGAGRLAQLYAFVFAVRVEIEDEIAVVRGVLPLPVKLPGGFPHRGYDVFLAHSVFQFVLGLLCERGAAAKPDQKQNGECDFFHVCFLLLIFPHS